MPPTNYDLSLISTNPLRARASFPPTFPGFDGHFPDAPILPGFMHIQLAVNTLELAGYDASLASVTNAKFLRGIPPAVEVEVLLTQIADDQYAVVITENRGDCSRFTLTVAQRASGQNS